MATEEQRDDVRRKAGIVGDGAYTDLMLDEYIAEADDDLNLAASRIWRMKASSYAEMVDISEAGSSRKNSDLFKNAQAMADHYEGESEEDPGVLEPGTYSTTRRIARL